MYQPGRRHIARDRIIDCAVKKLELRQRLVRTGRPRVKTRAPGA